MIQEAFILISLALGAYVLGSVPTAYTLVSWLEGEDIRDVGSRNVGAVNAFNRTGAWAGLLVLVVGTAKGVLAVAAPRLLGVDSSVLLVTTTSVVAGHNWPVFLNFRGGKGAAAIFGISLVIVPWLTVITAGPSILVMLLLRNVVLGAVFGFILLNTMLWVREQGAPTRSAADPVGYRDLCPERARPNLHIHQGPGVAATVLGFGGLAVKSRPSSRRIATPRKI